VAWQVRPLQSESRQTGQILGFEVQWFRGYHSAKYEGFADPRFYPRLWVVTRSNLHQIRL
jgi:hypothetical protein